MEIKYKTKNERIQVKINTDSMKDAFKQLAEFQEVFAEEKCGACNNEDIYFLVRTVEGNDYYELRCRVCNAKLAFGQHKTGGSLFPKRKLEDGNYDFKSRGWHKWSSEKSN
tara:strand:+ start:2032 stop:2364 length:333 start_codon:yes stop_codon:yes gene_type:complete